MKLICINTFSDLITLGKIYDCFDEFRFDWIDYKNKPLSFKIINDIGNIMWVDCYYFKELSEHRNEKLNEIGVT